VRSGEGGKIYPEEDKMELQESHKERIGRVGIKQHDISTPFQKSIMIPIPDYAKDIIIRVMWITPELAKYLLDNKLPNRKLRKYKVKQYIGTLIEGNWQLNGETIVLDEYGRLLDGQNRCEAIVTSKKNMLTIVVYGINREVFSSLNSGAIRRPVDVADILGVKNSRDVMSALRAVKAYYDGIQTFTGQRTYLRNDEVEDLLEKYPNIQESIKWRHEFTNLCRPSFAIAAHYIFSRINFEDAEDFANKFITGDGLSLADRTSSIVLLRNRLIADKNNKRTKLDRTHVFALIIKAWNAYRNNVTLKTLKFTDKEEFPVAI